MYKYRYSKLGVTYAKRLETILEAFQGGSSVAMLHPFVYQCRR